ncbi:SpoIIE family protein phosphatase [Streptomyces sp. TRM68367]|uniref:SpoIIE family protein phosphatase n=1 Tax=Streptomyces sp. TRM68367 TaxID=2758415 RepID=UPI0029343ECC|nr:SpoIIE family protein phosphatase [Streptomyces sp. TRM68367]
MSHADRTTSARPSLVAASDEGPWAAETLTLALQQATTCLDGLGALVHRRDPAAGRLHLVAASGLASGNAEAWADLYDLDDVAPARAVQHGAYVWVGRDSLRSGASGTAAVPLPGADGPTGALSVLTAGPGKPNDVQRSFLHSVAAWTAARLTGSPGTPPPGLDAAAGSERTLRMSELTAALAEALTSRDVVRAVADHVLPPFGADGLGVYAFEGYRMHVVGLVGYPQGYQGYWSRLRELPLTSQPIIADVLRAGTPLFVETKAALLRRYPEMVGLTATSPKNAWAFLPLIASGRAIGCCVVSFSRPRSFSEEERTLLTALSGLVAQALERARLYDAEHVRAQELQRGLLPRTLPGLPAVRAAARYLPAGRGEAVGGDWYDLIPLSADRVAMVIGDVMGHGITEAATMGRLRTAVRTLADLEMPPDELLSHLNDLVSDLGDDYYATCLYAIFDPVTRICRFSLAGHPPPVFVHPDGTVHIPDVAPDPPLGAVTPPFETHELRLPAESLVVLCTDGLIESATRDADQGLAQLLHTLAQAAARTPYFQKDRDDDAGRLEELCDTVTSVLLPDREQTDDDAALLIAHTRSTATEDVATCSFPHDPQAAWQAREYVRKQLAAWGLDDLIITTELLASELVGNAIRHAKGPLSLRLLHSRSLICEVYDGSLTTPRIRRAAYTDEGGRGLQLVAALSRRWGARYHHDGKCIWTEQGLPHEC